MSKRRSVIQLGVWLNLFRNTKVPSNVATLMEVAYATVEANTLYLPVACDEFVTLGSRRFAPCFMCGFDVSGIRSSADLAYPVAGKKQVSMYAEMNCVTMILLSSSTAFAGYPQSPLHSGRIEQGMSCFHIFRSPRPKRTSCS